MGTYLIMFVSNFFFSFLVLHFSCWRISYSCKVMLQFNLMFHNFALTFKQVDSFAVARDSEMHEATRRILSVLLRQVFLRRHTS